MLPCPRRLTRAYLVSARPVRELRLIDVRHGWNPHRVHRCGNERRNRTDERGHLSGLRATDDFALHNPACIRGELERVPMQAVWIFKDRAREQDQPHDQRTGGGSGSPAASPATSSLDTATKVKEG